ncbi:MAG: helix-turn-helix domain-containing protein [Ottowia sp.]|nr:helix-turn-helix domain-containing protein [Ottowia sp.]
MDPHSSSSQKDSGRVSTPKPVSPNSGQILLSLGQRLKKARVHTGLSLEELSARLKIAQAKLMAIEAGTLQLSHSVFERSMLRGYAKVVGADIESDLASLGNVPAQKNLEPTPMNLGMHPPVFKQYFRHSSATLLGAKWFWLAASFLVAVLLFYFIWVQMSVGQSEPVNTAELVAAPKPSLIPEVGVAPVADEVPQPIFSDAMSQPSVASVSDVPQNNSVPQSRVLVPQTPPVAPVIKPRVAVISPKGSVSDAPDKVQSDMDMASVIAPLTVGPVTPKSTGVPVLRIKFTGTSWYEVRDGSGKVLSSGVAAPDTEQSVSGTPPFALVLGDVTGVSDVYFRGKPVVLNRNKGVVVRVTLK